MQRVIYVCIWGNWGINDMVSLTTRMGTCRSKHRRFLRWQGNVIGIGCLHIPPQVRLGTSSLHHQTIISQSCLLSLPSYNCILMEHLSKAFISSWHSLGYTLSTFCSLLSMLGSRNSLPLDLNPFNCSHTIVSCSLNCLASWVNLLPCNLQQWLPMLHNHNA